MLDEVQQHGRCQAGEPGKQSDRHYRAAEFEVSSVHALKLVGVELNSVLNSSRC
jgi:hypothetical protein